MNKIVVLGLVLVIISCNNKNNNQLDDDPNSREVIDVSVAEHDTIEKKSQQVNLIEGKRRKYQSISNPDSALAYFLYETYTEFKPYEYQEEYQRFDLEYDKQILLIKNLFSQDENLENILDSIDHTRERFIDTIRERVYSDYVKYHGVSGMSFDFLLQRNDSIVKPLLYKLVEDNEASEYERKYANKVLFEHYGDSSYHE